MNQSSSRLGLRYAPLPLAICLFSFFSLFFIATSLTSLSVMITENLCYTQLPVFLIQPYFLALGSSPGTWSPNESPLLLSHPRVTLYYHSTFYIHKSKYIQFLTALGLPGTEASFHSRWHLSSKSVLLKPDNT